MTNSREYMRAYRNANKERHSYQDQQRREEHRRELLQIVGGGKCKDCGHADPRTLEFDHLRDKVANVSSFLIKNYEKALEEALKCEVVCANCHRIRTYERRPKFVEPETKWIRLSKDQCPNGHPKTSENIYEHGGKKLCRPCRTEYARIIRKKKKRDEDSNL